MKLRTTLIAGAVALGMAGPLSAQGFPDLGKIGGLIGKAKDAAPIDEAKEIEIGTGIASRLLGAAPLVPNPAMQQYVNKVGKWLAMQSERPDLPWHFGVLDSPNVNAFATPGGYVFVTHGLLMRMRSEDELAGVLAHEISHVVKKHHLVAIQKGAKRGMLTDVVGMAAANRGVNENWNKVLKAGTELYARGLDKGDEYEADRMGVVIATRAGYDPFGLPAVLQTLDSVNAADKGVALMFKTHPTPASRLELLDRQMGTSLDSYAGTGAPNPRFGSLAR